MGLFHRNRKEQPAGNAGVQDAHREYFNDSRLTNDDIQRLCNGAGNIVNMLRSVLAEPDGRLNIWRPLFYASGLAGYACHQAVKSIDAKLLVRVETSRGATFYFGDAVNYFLLESKYSVRGFCDGIYKKMEPQKTPPDCVEIVKNIASSIGSDSYRIWGVHKPEYVYKETRDCWDDIYNSMTVKYCKDASEWPVLFSIVLQNVIKIAADATPKEQVYSFAMENACYISKMDDDSCPGDQTADRNP